MTQNLVIEDRGPTKILKYCLQVKRKKTCCCRNCDLQLIVNDYPEIEIPKPETEVFIAIRSKSQVENRQDAP